jgi:magnesium transporter
LFFRWIPAIIGNRKGEKRMYYTFSSTIKESNKLPAGDQLTVGYLSCDELAEVSEALGFAAANVEACRSANIYFRSGVEVYDEYTFTELRIVDPVHPEVNDDCVALFIKKNLFLVIDVLDEDRSTQQRFQQALRRFPARNMTLEKLIYSFLDALVAGDIIMLESTGAEVNELEAQVLRDEADKDFNTTLLDLKNRLLSAHNYYEQLLDITDAVEENENDIFDTDSLMYISNIGKKIVRLREDVDALSNMVVHLQDAYSSYLDMNLNKTMKFFTVITSIFFPLTIIVGWYGMNFQSMPEFYWRFGYVYVIALSIIVVLALVLVGKRKKWF